ncbi:MAG: YcaO-like family protein [Pandoraea sp.]|nr:YcaO-like family protein [Pandoraea sp.]MDR3397043.1 YcaO-like family protein [Pandoraea sp.]
MKIETHAPLSRLTDIFPYLLDEHVGLINQVREHPAEADSPKFLRFNCTAANTEAFGEYQNFAIGGGAATTRSMALAKAIGEAIERYCAAIYDKRELPLVAYEKARFECVHPSEFVLYSDEQYAFDGFMFDPFTTASPVRWAPAVDLSTGDLTHVPAAMIYVPYFFQEGGDESAITQPISTGLSCHCSYEEAALGGLCEVVERDCFSITWQARLSRPRIRNTTLSACNRDLVARFEDVGYHIHLMDMRNETGVPAVLAVGRHSRDFLPIIVAASAAPSAEEAVRKALEELAHTERYAFQIKSEIEPLACDTEFDNILGQVDHVNFWTNPANARHAEFLFTSERTIDFCEMTSLPGETAGEQLTQLVSRIESSGYRALVCDITTPDVRDLGLTVVRALVPGYQPLFMGYHHRALGGKRLWTIPQRLGYVGITLAEGDFRYPHPFP